MPEYVDGKETGEDRREAAGCHHVAFCLSMSERITKPDIERLVEVFSGADVGFLTILLPTDNETSELADHFATGQKGVSVAIKGAVDERAAIAKVTKELGRSDDPPSLEAVTAALEEVAANEGVPPIDYVVFTGGRKKLGDEIFWSAAYSEFYFDAAPLHDLGTTELMKILMEFGVRDRRFGGLSDDCAEAG